MKTWPVTVKETFDVSFKILILVGLVLYLGMYYIELKEYKIVRFFDGLNDDSGRYSSFMIMSNAFETKLCFSYQTETALNNRYFFCDKVIISYGSGLDHSLKESIVKLAEEGKL